MRGVLNHSSRGGRDWRPGPDDRAPLARSRPPGAVRDPIHRGDQAAHSLAHPVPYLTVLVDDLAEGVVNVESVRMAAPPSSVDEPGETGQHHTCGFACAPRCPYSVVREATGPVRTARVS